MPTNTNAIGAIKNSTIFGETPAFNPRAPGLFEGNVIMDLLSRQDEIEATFIMS